MLGHRLECAISRVKKVQQLEHSSLWNVIFVTGFSQGTGEQPRSLTGALSGLVSQLVTMSQEMHTFQNSVTSWGP